jgi:hypothetical protein
MMRDYLRGHSLCFILQIAAGTYRATTPAGSAFGRKTNCGGCNGSFKQVTSCWCSAHLHPSPKVPPVHLVHHSSCHNSHLQPHHLMQQEFEAGTADGFASFPQQNGMGTCYNLLFVSPLPVSHRSRLATQHILFCNGCATTECACRVLDQNIKFALHVVLNTLRVSIQGTIASGGSGGLYASVKSTCPAMSKVQHLGLEPFPDLPMACKRRPVDCAHACLFCPGQNFP